MELLELLDKPEQRKIKILQNLLAKTDYISLTQLGQKTNTDRNTTKEDVEDLQRLLRGLQDHLQVEVEENPTYRVRLHHDYTISMRELYYFFLKDAVNYRILMCLFQHGTYDINRFADELLLSKATFFRRVTKLNELLAEFEIKIKNAQLVGTEAQIRIFYYQLFWQGVPLQNNQLILQDTSLTPLINHLEKKLDLRLSREARLKAQLWIFITKMRLKNTWGKTLTYWEPPLPFKPMNDKLKEFRHILFRYFSRYALSWNEEENALFYYTTISNLQTSITSKDFEEALWGLRNHSPLAYKLGRNFLALLGQSLDVNALSGSCREELLYALYQIHYRVLYFKGTITVVSPEELEREVLRSPVSKAVAEHFTKENCALIPLVTETVRGQLFYQYFSILWRLLQKHPSKLKVGYFFNFEQNYSAVVLGNIERLVANQLQIEFIPYDDDQQVDVLITNISKADFPTMAPDKIFVFMNFDENRDYPSAKEFLIAQATSKVTQLAALENSIK